ncbi:MAG: hypothetical protein OEY89_03090, partial [Gammaproteobacteria bacterium]|nr:hypothetical protein [Gammaproteobacteria bacterium]
MSVQLKSHIQPVNNTETGRNSETASITTKISLAHIAWITMFLSILIWNVSTSQTQSNTLGNTGNVYRIFLVLFSLAAGSYALMTNSGNLSKRLTFPIILLLIYAIVAFASSLLVPANSFYTMWKSMEIIIDLIIITAILCLKYPYENVLLAYKIIIVILVSLLLIFTIEAIMMPSVALIPSRGVIPFTMRGYIPLYNGNSLAFLCAVICYFVFCRMINTKKKQFLLYLLFTWAFVVLILAQSRTSLVGLVVAITVFTYFNKNKKIMIGLVIFGILSTALASFSAGIEAYLTRGQSKELMTSLSGRTHGWEAAVDAF